MEALGRGWPKQLEEGEEGSGRGPGQVGTGEERGRILLGGREGEDPLGERGGGKEGGRPGEQGAGGEKGEREHYTHRLLGRFSLPLVNSRVTASRPPLC